MKDDLQRIWNELKAEAKLNALFNQFSHDSARIISMMQNLDKRKLQNHPLYSQLKRLSEQFAVDLEALIVGFVSHAYEAAERKNDSLMMKYIKAAAIAISGKMLLKIFNRQSNDPDSVTLGNIVKQARNRSAYNQFIKNQLKLSPKVWKISAQNLKQIELYTSMGLAEGRSAAGISRDLRKFLNNPDARFRRIRDPETGKLQLSAPARNYHPGAGVYRSAAKNAMRVARTETNMAYRRADLARWRNIDFVTGYEVKLSAAHPREDICDFMIGKYPKGFEFTGFHPQCYCYAVPVMVNQDQFVQYIHSGKMPAHEKIKGIPPRAFNYVRDRSDKLAAMTNKPFWLQDNFTKKNGIFYPKKSL